MEILWHDVSNRLRERIGRVSFESWIAPLSFVGMHGRVATLQAPNKFVRDRVNDRYLNDLRQCLSAETGTEVEIALVPLLEDEGRRAVIGQEPISPPLPGLHAASPAGLGDYKLDPRYTFDGFVVGASNQVAHAAAVAVANEPGEKYNPLSFHGAIGLGKTHLAAAIGHQISRSGRGRQVLFAPAELFMNELIAYRRRGRIGDFKERMRRVDVLILDDVHFLAGRDDIQKDFFDAFDSLHAQRHQIVFTFDKPPRDLAGFEERLLNRFESGLIADIAPPDLETRIAILRKRAAAENLTLDAAVALFVAQSVSSNVRELEGCFNRLAALASLTKGAITLDLARESLRDLVRDGPVKPDIEAIQQHVSVVFHVRLTDLRSRKRPQHIAFCRQVAMYLCRKVTSHSLAAVGAGFGRDHSTVIHAYNLIAARVNKDAAFRRLIEKIERQLEGQHSIPPDVDPGLPDSTKRILSSEVARPALV